MEIIMYTYASKSYCTGIREHLHYDPLDDKSSKSTRTVFLIKIKVEREREREKEAGNAVPAFQESLHWWHQGPGHGNRQRTRAARQHTRWSAKQAEAT